MRHAWLILAHNQFPMLKKLIAFLDGEDSGIFLHIDQKAADAPLGELAAAAKVSPVRFVERRSISWGDFSMVEAELDLLRAAVSEGCDRFHLLSGVDAPIKSRDYIRSFFEEHPETNFINFQQPVIGEHELWRVRFYYPFQRRNIRKVPVRRALRNASIAPQLLLGVDRTKKYPELTFQKGAQWFSVTRAFAEYVLEREALIRRVFAKTYCPDELVMQTLAVSSLFRDTLAPHAFENDYRSCCRYIDWKRGNPYVFRETDLEELLHAPEECLFARKFDDARYPGLTDRLYAALAAEK